MNPKSHACVATPSIVQVIHAARSISTYRLHRGYRVMAVFVAVCVLPCSMAGCVTAQSHPNAVHTRDLTDQIKAGLSRRKINDEFNRFRTFTAKLLDDSAGDKTFSDKTGNCRLTWVDRALRDPVKSITEAEAFSRELHGAAVRPSPLAALSLMRERLDLSPGAPALAPSHSTIEGVLTSSLVSARADHDRAMAGVSEEQLRFLRKELYHQTTDGITLGHRFADKEIGREVCDVLELHVNRAAHLDAIETLSLLVSPELFFDKLAMLHADSAMDADGVEGKVRKVIVTDAGRIIIGSDGDNVYQLDELVDVCAVIDPGGNDTYIEGTLTDARPVLLIIDLAGDDRYEGEQPGIQGGAVLGVSMLVDVAGDDTYVAQDIAQGSAVGGAGVLIDMAGNDSYTALKRAQGQAIAGVGLLVDHGGDDKYRAALLAQGVGGALGFGVLEDVAGADHYFAGGLYEDAYDDSAGFGSHSQGCGVGPRGVANGGIGIILDGGGDDIYEADCFGHGGGYWFALGIARDFGGNDQRVGAVLTNHDGSERTEPRFVRWGYGYGCHYALGFIFDDMGNDTYGGDFACSAFAWDIAVTAICDFAGDDEYTVVSSGVAHAANVGLAALYDVAGNDTYRHAAPGTAPAKVDYHPMPESGGNFAFFIDEAGHDTYAGSDEFNGTQREHGGPGGFFIDVADKK